MRRALLILAAVIAALHATTSITAAAETPGRIGVYVSFAREVKSTDELRQTMKRMKAAGIDFIHCSGKGNVVYWDSRIAPRELIADATYMEKVVQCAHEEGLKVYPVFCVATEGGEGGPNALLTRNPSWAFFYDGARRGYIDPGNAEARRYEASLAAELVSKYNVDGLSLDYARCPNHVGYTDSGRAEFLEKHNVDLAKIAGGSSETLDSEGGKKAAASAVASARRNPIWPEWRKWKTEQVNSLVRELGTAVRKAKPGLPISSYVWGYRTYTNNSEVCQDWMTWIKEGTLDWINPSGYRYDDESFRQTARQNREHVLKGFPFYITIGVKTSHGELKDAAEVRKQMNMARESGADGLIFFTWEALRPFADELAADIKSFRSINLKK